MNKFTRIDQSQISLLMFRVYLVICLLILAVSIGPKVIIYCTYQALTLFWRFVVSRHITVRTSGHWQNPDGSSDREDAERARTQDRQRPSDPRQVRRRVRSQHPETLCWCGRRRKKDGTEFGWEDSPLPLFPRKYFLIQFIIIVMYIKRTRKIPNTCKKAYKTVFWTANQGVIWAWHGHFRDSSTWEALALLG